VVAEVHAHRAGQTIVEVAPEVRGEA